MPCGCPEIRCSTPPYVIREDKWVVHTAVTNDAHALQWAFPPALDDMDVVLTAVANCWLALDHVSIRWKYDRKVLRVAATGCRLCEMRAQQTPACLRKQWSECAPCFPVLFCFVCSDSFVWCGLFHLTLSLIHI